MKDLNIFTSEGNIPYINKESSRKMIRLTHLYDSLEDSEDINKFDNDNYYISPESNFVYCFDLLIIICLVICFIYIPIKISYYKNKCININSFDKISFYFIDTTFILDLIISMFKGYYNSQFHLISDNKKIFKNYLSTFFAYDFISGLPILSITIHYCLNSVSQRDKFLSNSHSNRSTDATRFFW